MTEIDASYRGLSLSGTENMPVKGTFLILAIRDLETHIEFDAADVIDGRRRVIRGDTIFKIDGMDIPRLASTFGLAVDGGKDLPPRRRGRRPREAA